MRRTAISVVLAATCLLPLTACTSTSRGGGRAAVTVPSSSFSAPSATSVAAPASTAAPVPSSSQPLPASSTSPRARSSSSTAAGTSSSGRLPLSLGTGAATQVITAVASSTSSTQGTLQAWQRGGSGWIRVGPAVHAWFGSQGLTTAPSESKSATPIGSFTLTEAFGHDANPGTALPYRQTTPADWWISQSGPLYNTEQHCSSGCSFTQGSPNEHLYYETPYYNYAVVIDYNRFPVHQGAGSAFFLHVTVGAPTAGCVSIDETDLVRILRWLSPADHPRILIGLA